MSETQKLPGRGSPPSTPRWVKILVILFILLILLVVILHLMGFGFGGHGVGGVGELRSGVLVGYALATEPAMGQRLP